MAKILIVEDSETDETLLLSFIDPGHSCLTVDSGRGAIALIEKAVQEREHFDLALIDIMLPDIEGLVVLEILRKLEKEADGVSPAKVVLVSGISDPQIINRAKGIGVDGYIKKPIDREILEQELKTLGIVAD